MQTPTDGEDEDGPALPFAVKGLIWVLMLIIVAALVVPLASQEYRRLLTPNDRKAKADIRAIAAAVQSYALLNRDQLPGSLEPLVQPDENGLRFLPIETVPLDPWKHPYHYGLCAEPPGFRVSSLGADGAPGGEGDDQDFDNITIETARALAGR